MILSVEFTISLMRILKNYEPEIESWGIPVLISNRYDSQTIFIADILISTREITFDQH